MVKFEFSRQKSRKKHVNFSQVNMITFEFSRLKLGSLNRYVTHEKSMQPKNIAAFPPNIKYVAFYMKANHPKIQIHKRWGVIRSRVSKLNKPAS